VAEVVANPRCRHAAIGAEPLRQTADAIFGDATPWLSGWPRTAPVPMQLRDWVSTQDRRSWARFVVRDGAKGPIRVRATVVPVTTRSTATATTYQKPKVTTLSTSGNVIGRRGTREGVRRSGGSAASAARRSARSRRQSIDTSAVQTSSRPR
jgi:hypothetical protein